MAVKLPFKLDIKTIGLIVSLVLNLLGGTGTIEPLVGEAPAPVCPPAFEPPHSTLPEPVVTPPAGPATN